MNAMRITEVLGSVQLSLLWICVIVAAMVFAAMIYSTAAFGRSELGRRARTYRAMRELAWTVVPIFIVIAAAAPAMKSAIPSRGDGGLVTDTRGESCLAPPAGAATVRMLSAPTGAGCAQHR